MTNFAILKKITVQVENGMFQWLKFWEKARVRRKRRKGWETRGCCSQSHNVSVGKQSSEDSILYIKTKSLNLIQDFIILSGLKSLKYWNLR